MSKNYEALIQAERILVKAFNTALEDDSDVPCRILASASSYIAEQARNSFAGRNETECHHPQS